MARQAESQVVTTDRYIEDALVDELPAPHNPNVRVIGASGEVYWLNQSLQINHDARPGSSGRIYYRSGVGYGYHVFLQDEQQ